MYDFFRVSERDYFNDTYTIVWQTVFGYVFISVKMIFLLLVKFSVTYHYFIQFSIYINLLSLLDGLSFFFSCAFVMVLKTEESKGLAETILFTITKYILTVLDIPELDCKQQISNNPDKMACILNVFLPSGQVRFHRLTFFVLFFCKKNLVFGKISFDRMIKHNKVYPVLLIVKTIIYIP